MSYSDKEDSLKRRYFYKLTANFFALIISFFTQAIVPRGLGPKAYGDFNFLTNFFTQVAAFFDMGTSAGFYTKLSQRPREPELVLFYLYFSFFVSIGMSAFVSIATMTPYSGRLWPDQGTFFIYLAAGWGILSWIIQVFNQMVDAYGLTVPAETARIIQKVFGLLLIMLLYVYSSLNLANYFYCQYLTFILLGLIYVWVLERGGYSLFRGWQLSYAKIKGYCREFYSYSNPLLIYALVGLIVGILDRWLLQIYAGSIQQGFYGLSYQIGALCFMFTGAMSPLLTREFSIAFGKGDMSKMAILFRRYIPLLYSIAAYFSCFIAMQSDKVVYIMGGKGYTDAATAVAIMAFYPVHQTYGQLSGSVFFATGQTRLYRNIGILFMLLGLPVTYLLIAPVNNWGLNAGATGLAVKMVIAQFIVVNVQLYYNARFLQLSFLRYLGHQLLSTICMLVAAYIATVVVEQNLQMSMINRFILSGFLYTMMIAGIGYSFPSLFGLNKGDIETFVNSFFSKIKA